MKKSFLVVIVVVFAIGAAVGFMLRGPAAPAQEDLAAQSMLVKTIQSGAVTYWTMGVVGNVAAVTTDTLSITLDDGTLITFAADGETGYLPFDSIDFQPLNSVVLTPRNVVEVYGESGGRDGMLRAITVTAKE